jgi:ATP-dependent protease ClpP protease subunit
MSNADRIRALLAQRPRSARPLAAVRREPGQSWYRIRNQADQPTAEIWLYDTVGMWGITAGEFVDDLTQLHVQDITLHINSPGGEVWDGLAIYHALREHPARVTVRVDGAALSAASFIAMAGDRVLTAAQSQWMVHDAWGECIGNADDMTVMAAVLDQMSQMIAEIYHDRIRGGVTKWRNLMRAEEWLTGQQAVDAGLADELIALPARQQDEALSAAAQWDLTRFAHPERAVALASRWVGAVVVPESGDVPGPGAVDDAVAPPALEPPAVAVPTPQPAAAGPTLDLGRMRAAVSAAVPKPFDLGRLRDAVSGSAAAPPAPEPRPPRAFPAAPLPAEPPPVQRVAPALGRRLAAAVAGVTANAPAPESHRGRPAAPPPLPVVAPAPPADPAAAGRQAIRVAFAIAASDTPAPPEPDTPEPPAGDDRDHQIDIGALRRALRGATL